MAEKKMGTGPAARILEQLDEVLAMGGPEAKKVWDVLGAVRGPDGQAEQPWKAATTSVLRSVAFPKTAQQVRRGYVALGADFGNGADASQTVNVKGLPTGHFRTHVAAAAVALGLVVVDEAPHVTAERERRASWERNYGRLA